jgi:hypothetical protein
VINQRSPCFTKNSVILSFPSGTRLPSGVTKLPFFQVTTLTALPGATSLAEHESMWMIAAARLDYFRFADSSETIRKCRA